MVESIENVNEYHSVFAQSIATAMNALMNYNDDKVARKLMMFTINYAFTQYTETKDPDMLVENIIELRKKLNLSNLSTDDMITMMSYYQAKAKMKPVQLSDGKARLWQRLKNRF